MGGTHDGQTLKVNHHVWSPLWTAARCTQSKLASAAGEPKQEHRLVLGLLRPKLTRERYVHCALVSCTLLLLSALHGLGNTAS